MSDGPRDVYPIDYNPLLRNLSMPDRQTIEPRTATTEPLVERMTNGSFVPTGRRFSDAPRADGLNEYGLTDAENIAFADAHDRLSGLPPQEHPTKAEGEAMLAAGINTASTETARAAFRAAYRSTHPLPTSFAELAASDPSSNYATVTIASVADGAAVLVTPVVAPVAQPAPATGDAVTIPPAFVASFPVGTTVVAKPDGSLVASVPAKEGGFHHVVAGVGHGIERLARNVAAFIKRVL